MQYGDVRDVTPRFDDEMDESKGTTPGPRFVRFLRSRRARARLDVTLVTSPKSQAGIVNFIRSASKTLEIEQMSFH